VRDPLTWLYAQVIAHRNARYDRGQAEVLRLRRPVISVGNLSVGGSGKTPFVQMLGRWLAERGIAYDILSRGYGRKTKGVLRVDPAGPADDFGDEPLLLARTLGVPVFVGEDRHAAGVAAEEFAAAQMNPARLHLLDDGFQHRRLHRDFDIVLLNPADLRGRLLPFGRLREPLASLERAQAVAVPADFATLLPKANVWRTRRRIEFDVPPPSRPLAFCGLANPKQFWQSLEAAGVQVAGTYSFGDHHRYTARDMALLKNLTALHGADGYITTAKDEVKLPNGALTPLAVPQLRVEVEEAELHFASLLEQVGVR